MAERRTIGDILMDSGRIDADDVARALEYQRSHGGYFGEALVGLGLATEEELDWSLASQYDLPYVFLDADSIDSDAARLVSAEWALAHMTLPIARVGDTLRVIVDSPIRTSAIDHLSKRTDCEIELALASGPHIRELIRSVYATPSSTKGRGDPSPVDLDEALRLALTAGAGRFGISTRGGRSMFWYDEGDAAHRRVLLPRWAEQLDDVMSPPPSEAVRRETRTEFTATLNRDGVVSPVEVRYLADETGHEYLIRPIEQRTALKDRFTPPGPDVTSEVRMLCRSGSARFAVTTDSEGLGNEIMPHLPGLLLDPHWRSIHVTVAAESTTPEAFTLGLPEASSEWGAELDSLRPFRFDVVTVDLPMGPESWLERALDVASIAFVRWPTDRDRATARDAGIRWELHVSGSDDGRLDWTLAPLRT